MGSGEDAGPGWNFFVSYTQADRAWAEWIAWTLEENGYRVLVQAWDMVPGINWIARMQDGVREADRTVAVLSEDYLGSVYGGAEWQAAWAQDPAGTDRKLLPVRVKPCDWERLGLLTGVAGIDLVGLDETAAAGRLRSEVSAAVTGRAKPPVAPGFPGPDGARAVPRARFPGGTAGVWQGVPAWNPNFTGRGGEIAALAAGLAAGPRVTVQSVHGMGGVGKTQLAAEYAYAHAGDYDLVFWITADEPALIADQFAALAARLGLDPEPDPEAVRAQVHEKLRETGDWLLIFDNADEVDGIRKWLPGGPRPAGVRGHVIITTRRGGFASVGAVLDLDVIGTGDAAALLRTRVPDLDQQTGERIAEELGRLPLALEQAAAYLDQAQIPPGEYLELLQDRAAEMHARGRPGDRPDTIATLWDLSLEKITQEDLAAVQLLDICAYLAPRPVPLDLFTSHPDRLREPLAAAAGDRLAFIDTVAVIVDYSLAKRTPAGLQLHRLVQAAIRGRHAASPPLKRPGDPMPADEPVHAVPPAVALGLLRADAPEKIVGVPQDWPRWAVLLPHVLAATSLPSPAGHDVAADTAWLLDRAAAYLQVHGRPADARPLAERALAITEATLDKDHPDVANRLTLLAGIVRDLGLSREARPLAERALAIDEAALGPKHLEVATDLNNLAAIMRDLGLSREARPLAERALAITEAALGPGHPYVAIRLTVLALIIQDLELAEQARPLAERALAITEAALGPDNPIVAIRLSNLAMILRDLGLSREARPLAERALAIDEAALGPDHPDVAIRLGNLAAILRDLGLAGEARPLAERAAAITGAARQATT
jgi:tetratricopeptide (TPR) repeat protein